MMFKAVDELTSCLSGGIVQMELLNTSGQSYRAIVNLLEEGSAEHQLLVWAS